MCDLVLGVHAADRVEDLAIDGVDRLADALAEEARLVAVPQFDRLMGTGRGARRNRRAAHRTVFEGDIDLHRRIAAAVQYFPPGNIDDCSHDRVPLVDNTAASTRADPPAEGDSG